MNEQAELIAALENLASAAKDLEYALQAGRASETEYTILADAIRDYEVLGEPLPY